MAFKCDGKNYVYNITDNELYETEHDVSEITVLKGCIAVFGSVSIYSFDDDYEHYDYVPYVVNLKTGEQYADVRPFYDNKNWNGSYLTVGTIEESFSGNKVSIGMLNDKGEWVLPLSADYAICKEKDIDKTQNILQNGEFIYFWANGQYNYDIANDRLIDGFVGAGVTDDKTIIYNDSANLIYDFYNYDVSTGEKTFITETGYLAYETPTCRIYQDTDGGYIILDQNYNLLEYDLSEYDLGGWRDENIKGATEDVIVFDALNEERDTYTIIMNKDGSYVCEPFKEEADAKQKFYVYFTENKIIFFPRFTKFTGAARIIDRNTGEITTIDDSYVILDFDTENNLMLVNTNGAYYLADPEAPDVLINPFERAKN